MSTGNTTTAHESGQQAAPLAARMVLGILGNLAHGHLVVGLPDGSRREFGRGGPTASIEVRDWAAFGDILRSGDVGFGEAYMAGRWHTPDLAGLLTLFASNRDAIERALYGGFWGGLAYRVRHWLNANTRRGSRRNISAHYDLGNDFYSLWLDRSMTYSSALFDGDGARDLESAQRAKYRRILDRLAPKAGDHILEIGCGWGGFAEIAAREYRCRVTGLTLSSEQLAFAQTRMRNAGVADRVSVELRDYRDVRGEFDHVVSIEMYEAVGERYWPAYFETIARVLRPAGKAIVQAITIDDRLFERYRAGTDFIQQHVFPGGMLASPERFRAESGHAGLEVTDAHAFGLDYAETLRRWRHMFLRQLPQVRAQGYDERFVRLWEFYLAYCEAGFATKCTDVYHFELSRRSR
ncbi:MAG: cyclopropane-fatty-acyl-phospholipid synthase family protein [Burkholderiales bacterium]|jgi:cyclopropane-fatty-acyl-phospholipid synthase|nr:cyclopropane-fatty-acyl-phospholipid synthase family protein [Burkholderiales bacterium]